MPKLDASLRDQNIVEHILAYCKDIAETHAEFDFSKERFLSSKTYQNAVGMCILQIGELVKHLSPDFIQSHPEIDWRAAARARDVYAHHYSHIDYDIAWETATSVIDSLTAFCSDFLS